MLGVFFAAVVVCGAAGDPVVVIDRSLKTTTGELVSLRDGSAVISVAGSEGRKDTQIASVAAVVAASAWGPDRSWPGLPKPGFESRSADGVLIELTDGTRLRGDLMTGKGDGLVLVSRNLGKVEFPLDSLKTLTIGAPPAVQDNTKNDSVRLLNGDRVEGFIESIGVVKGEGTSGDPNLAVTIERDKARTVIPLDRVAQVRMQGAAASRPPMSVWLGTAGSETTAASEFSIEKGEARIVRAKGVLAANIKADIVTGAVVATDAITPLSSCTPKGAIETGPDQILSARDLTIPEPGAASWELPKGAKRISGWAVLPEECRRWGDCTVTLTAGATGAETKLAEFTLNSATPVVAIEHDLPASAARLTVTVGEGKNGPVQDRVTLRRVLVATASK